MFLPILTACNRLMRNGGIQTVPPAATQPPQQKTAGNAAAKRFMKRGLARKRIYEVVFKAADGATKVVRTNNHVKVGYTIMDGDAMTYTAVSVKRVRPSRDVEWGS